MFNKTYIYLNYHSLLILTLLLVGFLVYRKFPLITVILIFGAFYFQIKKSNTIEKFNEKNDINFLISSAKESSSTLNSNIESTIDGMSQIAQTLKQVILERN